MLVSGHPSLATHIGSDWMFWQTGYPDLFATDAVLASMWAQGLVGTLAIFTFAILLRRRRRHAT